MSKGSTKKAEVRTDDEPSAESLREIPELGPDAVRLGRGEEGWRMARGLGRAMRGRPKKGETAAGSSTRSMRLTDAQWETLEWLAQERGMTAHGAMREAVVLWIARAGDKLDESKRAPAKAKQRNDADAKAPKPAPRRRQRSA